MTVHSKLLTLPEELLEFIIDAVPVATQPNLALVSERFNAIQNRLALEKTRLVLLLLPSYPVHGKYTTEHIMNFILLNHFVHCQHFFPSNQVMRLSDARKYTHCEEGVNFGINPSNKLHQLFKDVLAVYPHLSQLAIATECIHVIQAYLPSTFPETLTSIKLVFRNHMDTNRVTTKLKQIGDLLRDCVNLKHLTVFSSDEISSGREAIFSQASEDPELKSYRHLEELYLGGFGGRATQAFLAHCIPNVRRLGLCNGSLDTVLELLESLPGSVADRLTHLVGVTFRSVADPPTEELDIEKLLAFAKKRCPAVVSVNNVDI